MEKRTDETLQKNMKRFPEFYKTFCRIGNDSIKYCSFYGYANLCPVRCNYAIELERIKLEQRSVIESELEKEFNEDKI